MNKEKNTSLEQTLVEFGPHLFDVGRHLFIDQGRVVISDEAPDELKEIYSSGKTYFDRMYLRYLYLYNKYRSHAVMPKKTIEELMAYCTAHFHTEYIGVVTDPYLLAGHIRNLIGLNPDTKEEDLEFIGYYVCRKGEELRKEEHDSMIVFEIRHDFFGTWNQTVLREMAYQRGIDEEDLDKFNFKAWNYLIDCDAYFTDPE